MTGRTTRFVVGAALLVLAIAAAVPASADGGRTERVSVSLGVLGPNGPSAEPSLSSDGRYVAFRSAAENLVESDGNGYADVFVRDRRDGSTILVSKNVFGGGTDGNSYDPAISADGRYVAFVSESTYTVWGDSNRLPDVFLADLATGETTLVSWGIGGAPANAGSRAPSISANGRYVLFESAATNLVAGDTNGATDVFRYDRVSRTTERVSLGASGSQIDSHSFYSDLSDDGRVVSFSSIANNVVAGDSNAKIDVFVRDLTTGSVERASVSSTGTQGDGHSWRTQLSGDGSVVVFWSESANLAAADHNGKQDVFAHDVTTGVTELISVTPDGTSASAGSVWPSISADGRLVVFMTSASELTGDDLHGWEDVYLRDRVAGTTTLVSLTNDGLNGLGHSMWPEISADGSVVAFVSDAPNFEIPDLNRADDVFVRTR